MVAAAYYTSAAIAARAVAEREGEAAGENEFRRQLDAMAKMQPMRVDRAKHCHNCGAPDGHDTRCSYCHSLWSVEYSR